MEAYVGQTDDKKRRHGFWMRGAKKALNGETIISQRLVKEWMASVKRRYGKWPQYDIVNKYILPGKCNPMKCYPGSDKAIKGERAAYDHYARLGFAMVNPQKPGGNKLNTDYEQFILPLVTYEMPCKSVYLDDLTENVKTFCDSPDDAVLMPLTKKEWFPVRCAWVARRRIKPALYKLRFVNHNNHLFTDLDNGGLFLFMPLLWCPSRSKIQSDLVLYNVKSEEYQEIFEMSRLESPSLLFHLKSVATDRTNDLLWNDDDDSEEHIQEVFSSELRKLVDDAKEKLSRPVYPENVERGL